MKVEEKTKLRNLIATTQPTTQNKKNFVGVVLLQDLRVTLFSISKKISVYNLITTQLNLLTIRLQKCPIFIQKKRWY